MKKRQLELNMLEEQVARLKRHETLARQELSHLQIGLDEAPEQAKTRASSANAPQKLNRIDKASEEE